MDDENLLPPDGDEALEEVATVAPGACSGCGRIREIITVEPVMFLYFLACVSSFPTFQQYVYGEVSRKHDWNPDSSSGNCTPNVNQSDVEKDVQQEVSRFMLLSGLVSLLPSAVATLFLGHYSDCRGRKIALMAPLVGGLLRAAFNVCVAYFRWNINFLLLGAVLESLSGGAMTMLMAAFAYIADITTDKSRSQRIFIVEGTVSLAVATATIATGYMIRDYGFTIAFLFGLVTYGIGTLVTLLYIKETVQAQASSFFTLEHVTTTLRLYSKSGYGRRWKLWLLLLFVFISLMVDNGNGNVATVFLLGFPICFDSVLLGFYQAANFAFRAVGGFIYMKILQRWLPDSGFIILGFISMIAGGITMGFASTRTIVFIVPLLSSAGLLVVPFCRSLSSKLVLPQEQGALFAAIAFAEQLSIYLGGILLNLIYMVTLHTYWGIVFFIGAGIVSLTLALAIFFHCRTYKREQQTAVQ